MQLNQKTAHAKIHQPSHHKRLLKTRSRKQKKRNAFLPNTKHKLKSKKKKIVHEQIIKFSHEEGGTERHSSFGFFLSSGLSFFLKSHPMINSHSHSNAA
jgi:hypothetical protein